MSSSYAPDTLTHELDDTVVFIDPEDSGPFAELSEEARKAATTDITFLDTNGVKTDTSWQARQDELRQQHANDKEVLNTFLREFSPESDYLESTRVGLTELAPHPKKRARMVKVVELRRLQLGTQALVYYTYTDHGIVHSGFAYFVKKTSSMEEMTVDAIEDKFHASAISGMANSARSLLAAPQA